MRSSAMDVARLLGAYAAAAGALEPAGSYVAGSLALGAFDPVRSDVDIVTFTRGAPDVRRIAALHARLRAYPDTRRLEITYVDADRPLAPGLRVARGRVRGLGRLTAVARTEIHAHPIVLAGSPGLVPVPTRADLDREMAWNLDVYWRGQRGRLDHFLFASWIEFAVTTLARILWTLRFGTITSKPEAVRWLPDAVPPAAPLCAAARSGNLWARARAVQHLIDLARYHRDPCASASPSW